PTLHGFAQRLLAEFPLEAGLPPTFEVLDDIQASLAFDDRWRGFVDACFADAALERPIVVLAAVGLGMRQVERLVRLVHAAWDRLGAHEIGAEAAHAAGDRALVAAIRGVLRARLDCARATVAERRAEGRLEFRDLLVLARDVLRGDRTVRRALHDRYQVVLIDEFQDTDPLQIEIAALVVTDDDDVAGRPASALRIPDGRLFMVGDPKQSIYRFRRADIALYHQIRDALGDRVSLTQNHRSRPGILAFANAVFRDLMLGDGVLQAEFAALDAVRSPCSATPVPVVVLGDAVPTDARTALRRTDALDIASPIRPAVDEQRRVGGDTGDPTPSTRPPRP